MRKFGTLVDNSRQGGSMKAEDEEGVSLAGETTHVRGRCAGCVCIFRAHRNWRYHKPLQSSEGRRCAGFFREHPPRGANCGMLGFRHERGRSDPGAPGQAPRPSGEGEDAQVSAHSWRAVCCADHHLWEGAQVRCASSVDTPTCPVGIEVFGCQIAWPVTVRG